jgi:hypothetical protein
MERTGRHRGGGFGGSAAALLAGAVLRGLFLYWHPRYAGDALTYGDLAHNMLAHHIFGFSDNVIRPTLIRLPGYPAFLALCFILFDAGNYLPVLWVQAAVDLLSCSLLGSLAGRLMGRRAGLAVLWLAALCPFTANYAAAALTETLSIFCVVLAFFSLERWIALQSASERGLKWACTVGLALAFAVLLRPDQGLLSAAIVPAMLWTSFRASRQPTGPQCDRRWVCPGLVVLIVALPLLLWGVRNWRVFHVIQPLAPRYANDPGEPVLYGFQRWYRSWGVEFKSTVDVYWAYDGSTVALKDLPPRAFDSPAQREQTAAILARYNDEQASTPWVDNAFTQLAAQRAAQHPLRQYVAMPLAREADMWLRPRTELMRKPLDWWNVRAHPGASAFEIAYGLLNLAYLVLAALGLWYWRSMHWQPRPALAMAMLAFVALRSLLLLTLDNSEPRYTLECYPVVILLAGFAIAIRSKENLSA